MPAVPTERRDDLNTWVSASVGSLLTECVRRDPGRLALRWFNGPELLGLSWAELAARAAAGARLLNSPAARPGPVAIWANNSPNWYVALWATALAGRPLVPVNPHLTIEEAARIVIASGAGTVLMKTRDDADRVRLASALQPSPLAHDVSDLDEWSADVAQRAAETVFSPADDRARPESTFLIQYTSGTTGAPKGALLSHQVCVNAARTLTARLEPGAEEVWCSPIPLHHVGGSLALALGTAVAGGTYVMVSEFTGAAFAQAASQTRATLLGGVPTLFLRILEDPELEQVQLPHLRAMLVGGGSIPANLVGRLEDRFSAAVSVMYGQSEAPAITQSELGDPIDVKAATVGRPLPLRELRIVDPSTATSTPTGSVGEICVRTRVRMDGYLDDPAATSATIDSDGWLHTGDLGRLEEQGRLTFCGRLKEMIVRGGENIYAREVENVIESHPDVSHAAVVGLPDETWGEIVAAAVVPRPDTQLGSDELKAHVARHLAPFKRPVIWHITDQLPMTPSGKPQKFKIVETLSSEV